MPKKRSKGKGKSSRGKVLDDQGPPKGKDREGDRKDKTTYLVDPYDSDDSSEDDGLNVRRRLPLDGVVKLDASQTHPDYESPWQVEQSEESVGTGFVVAFNGGKRILTNAHVVANASFVSVRVFGGDERVPASVECISHRCDLALLKVSGSLLKRIDPLKLSTRVPHLQDEVYVAGYGEGGDSLALTKGIVSRMELGAYTPSLNMLQIQIDAAINAGASGGPVFRERTREVVGVAFAGLEDAEAVGYIIPTPVIHHFLRETAKSGSNRFPGICSLGIQVQTLENSSHRKAYHLPSRESGVLIRHVDPDGPSFGRLRVGDILLSINDECISNDGTVRWKKRERIHFSHKIHFNPVGTPCVAKVWREKKEKLSVEVKLQVVTPMVNDSLAALPLYICWAGLVLVPLSIPFLMCFCRADDYDEIWEEWPEVSKALKKRRTRPAQQIIVLARVLTHEVNFGYDTEEGCVLESVNGKDVTNLPELYDIISNTKTGYITFEFDSGLEMTFDAAQAHKATPKILKRHMVGSVSNLEETCEKKRTDES